MDGPDEFNFSPKADILAQWLAAYHVQVAVCLALHGVGTEVGQKPEAVRAVLMTQFQGLRADPGEELPTGPQLALRQVPLGYEQQHDRHPVKVIVERQNVLILVSDAGGRTP